MDHSHRYRRARNLFEKQLDELIQNLDPQVFETALGQTTVAAALAEKAIDILVEQADAKFAREVLTSIMDQKLRSGS
jgi:hypothetical protein